MSSNKKRLMRRVFSTNIGSCGCAKKKAIEVHEPIQKAKISISQISKASSNTTLGERKGAGCSVDHSDDFSTTTFSEAETTQNYSPPKHSPLSNTVVVEKDYDDPYHDFKHSMLQMIFEDEIDSEDDLRVLLRCFLHLNDTYYHLVIVKVFNDICHEAFPDKVCTTTSSAIKPSDTVADDMGRDTSTKKQDKRPNKKPVWMTDYTTTF